MKSILLLSCCAMLATSSFSAVLTVTNNGDSGAGSLRDQIAAASSTDTIMFDAAVDGSVITLTTGALLIDKDIVIIGNGASNTIIDGNNASPLFDVTSFTLSMEQAMLQNALGSGTSGCLTSNNTFTADIDFLGCEMYNLNMSTGNPILFDKNNNPNTVYFEDCYIHENGTTGGNRLCEGNNIDLSNTTVDNNTTTNRVMHLNNNSDVTNCTFTDNTHGDCVLWVRNATLINSTIANNSNIGVELSTANNTVNLYNNIIYGNGGSNVYTPSIATIPGPTYNTEKNIVGPTSGPFTPSFYSSANPLLDGAGTMDNGGPTPTLAIMTGSPAIDDGSDAWAPPEDQRYFARIGVADIGAFEFDAGSACSETTSSFTVAACASYTVPSGDETYTSSGTVNDTIPNLGGCDSVMTITIDLGNTTSSPSVTVCNDYTVPSGDETYTSSGIYNDTIPNAAGCDSIMTIDVTINTIDVGVTQTGITLMADLGGATYQWIDCNTMADIPGETGQSFTPTANGSYAVIVDDGSCSDTSACFTISDLGINEISSFEYLLYPNPTSGGLTIQTSVNFGLIYIVDLSGRTVFKQSISNSTMELDLSELTNGTYYITIENSKGAQTKKLLKI